MQDTVLRLGVLEELSGDPRVDAGAVTVVAEAGALTLQGTVSSPRQRRDAVQAARRVGGVRRVRDTLTAWLPPAHRRDDADLHCDVLHALLLDVSIPTTVNAFVRDGVVTLMGFVTWHHERLEAEPAQIMRAAQRVGLPGAVSLSCADATVTVAGSVPSRCAHGRVLALAWSAPGTLAVHDRLTVG